MTFWAKEIDEAAADHERILSEIRELKATWDRSKGFAEERRHRDNYLRKIDESIEVRLRLDNLMSTSERTASIYPDDPPLNSMQEKLRSQNRYVPNHDSMSSLFPKRG